MKINFRIYLAVFLLICSAACTSKYAIVKSNREEYNINQATAVDSNIIKTYLPYKTQVEAEMNRIIGYTDVSLIIKSDVPESVMGNFFADAVYNQVKKIEPRADFVFPTTKGGLRNDIWKGPITVSSIFELMPFENELVLFNLKGEDVLKVAGFIAAKNGQPVTGLKMNIKDGKPENIVINGKPFDMTKNYWVVTSDYIGNGGDDSAGFATPISRKNIGLKVRDALMMEVERYQSEGKKFNTTLDGRITKN